ncbi:MAG: biopolymer transporter Tol [Planctomycetales bacterium]|nr:biopolymer transporter Tol [Planctomycetales bacterium]
MSRPAIAIVLGMLAGCGSPEPAPPPGSPSGAPPDRADSSHSVGEARWLRNVRQLTHGGVRSGESYFDTRGERVLFMSVRDGYPFFQIYLADLRGVGEPRRVSTGRGKTTCPWFHPDGERFLYASTHLDPGLAAKEEAARAEAAKPPAPRTSYAWDFDPAMDLFEARLDGTILRRLTDAPGYDAECAWSPDGSRIVFTSERDGDLEVYTMAADGTDVRRVTNAKGYDGGSFFSPDGRRIVWRGDRRGDQKLQIFIADADGGNARQVTDDDAVNWGPFFHPDGRRIVYASSRLGHRNYELFLRDLESGREERVTWTEGFDGLPAFSNDGSRLLWTSRRGGGDSQVWIADWVDGW